jgi:Putative transposase/Transposase zinc-binding domain
VSRGPAQAGRARFDIGEIVRAHRAQLEAKYPLTREQKRVLTDIGQCRTAALGGHVDHCPGCGYEHPSYNSCRNRHCPKCQALAQEKWIAQRSERLLDVGHFHVVFTLPSELRWLAKLAPTVVFDALFHAVARTLLELGESRLEAILGATLVLHTWTRELTFHPHIHAIVTAGGLALDGVSFVPKRGKYLFPVKVMGALFRGKMLAALSRAHSKGAFAHVRRFDDPKAFASLVASVARLSWNVYAKAPMKTSNHVVSYLGRYTHRVGIANSRLVDVTDDRVVFHTRNGATETLDPVEFLARLVQHVLPDGFHKIRHVGLYGSPKRLDEARARLGSDPVPSRRPSRSTSELLIDLIGRDVRLCPHCLTSLLPRPLPDARAPPLGAAA